mgnify:CR=1 FL=1
MLFWIQLPLIGLLLSCDPSPQAIEADREVLYAGALRSIMHQGDVSVQMDLDDLKDRAHLYALGAVEDLKGNEKLIEFNNLLKQRRLDKEIPSAKTENGIYRYRVTTKFVSSPVVDLRAIPLVGNLPIVCEPTPISIVTYRSAEHPEILTR